MSHHVFLAGVYLATAVALGSAPTVSGTAESAAGVENTVPTSGPRQAGRDDTHVYAFKNKRIRQFCDTYDWGYFCGVKQPLGAYKNGLSIHLIDKPKEPLEELANPDHIFWVNENEETHGISMHATGQDDGWYKHPGGMVSFGEDGTIWCNIGARASKLPLDLYRSDSPYDVENFTVALDDYETWMTSTTPCLVVSGSKIVLLWRHGWSSSPETTARIRRYDIEQGFGEYEIELDIGKGAYDAQYGQIGLEQCWTKFDPRFGYIFASWQWWDYPDAFGDLPFIYSDDLGDTWRTPDGAALENLPVRFPDRTPAMVPYDHFASGDQAAWNVRDIGVGPGGTFWMTSPVGQGGTDGQWKALFWLFNGVEWESRDLSGTMEGEAKPHAVGVTRDYLVFIYSEWSARHQLKARISGDDGCTWSDPVLIDEIPGDSIPWISFVQPADGYPDNTVRFFYSHYRQCDGWPGKRWMNNIRWVKFDVVQTLSADLTGDGVVDIDDLFAVLDAWGLCADPICPADLNCDAVVDIDDLFIVLYQWST